MIDLRERLLELAEAAGREGHTAGPHAAIRRGRRRRLALASGTVVLLVLALLAGAVGTGRLTDRDALLAPPGTDGPATTQPAPPDASHPPDRGAMEVLPGVAPPGRVYQRQVRELASELGRCRGGAPGGPKVIVGWGKALVGTWMLAATPPRPGEDGLGWSHGLFDVAGAGAGGIGNHGRPGTPLERLEVSGEHNIRAGNRYWGQVVGVVSKRAARVLVLFDRGIAPLWLEPIKTPGRFPVNFFVGFYRQPDNVERPATWQVTRVIAFDAVGATVAVCQATGPGHSC
jgi:hypothetical protein